MPRGGARQGAGRPPKALSTHVRANTYRPDRHGSLPGNVVALPAPSRTETCAPTEADLANVGPAGRAFVARMLAEHDGLSPVDSALLIETGHVVAALAAVRGVDRRGRTLKEHAQLDRLELAWSKQFAALIAQLRVESV
jgi:hypothetical protein